VTRNWIEVLGKVREQQTLTVPGKLARLARRRGFEAADVSAVRCDLCGMCGDMAGGLPHAARCPASHNRIRFELKEQAHG